MVLAIAIAQLIPYLRKASICRVAAVLVPSDANLEDPSIRAKD